MNTNFQPEDAYDYPAMLLSNQRESVENVENEVYNYATITN